MSRKYIVLGDHNNDLKSRPAILGRKRKADYDDSDKTPNEKPAKKSELTRSPFGQEPFTFSQFRGLTSFTPSPSSKNVRISPLPNFKWANQRDVWDLMVHKDTVYPRNHKMLLNHPELNPRARSILLNWLIEVCEAYYLHRETFYLAQDFIDRYLTVTTNVPKRQLQLVGITALFIAAKIEEIYPPKLEQFADVTDGACTESEILDKELIILETLKWDLNPVTINSWLSIYLQLASNSEKQPFLLRKFSSHDFAQVAQLLDLCILDVNCLQFSYSVTAASALYYKSSKKLVLSVSSLRWSDLLPCVNWMEPFAQIVKEVGGAQLKFFDKIDKNDIHNIQVHNTDMKLLEKVQAIQASRCTPTRMNVNFLGELLTPPRSIEKVDKEQ